MNVSPIYIEKLMEKLFHIGETIFRCLIIFIVCMLLIKISRILVRKIFDKQVNNKRLRMNERKARTLHSVVISIIKYLLYFVAIFTILEQLGIGEKSLLAIAGAGSVAIGMGAQTMIQDMLDGFFILFEDHFGVGDIVTTQGLTGTVEAITLRTTKIRDFNGSIHIIPNGSIGIVTNMCNEFMNAIVDIDVGYSENMNHVLEVLKDEMKHCSDINGLLEIPEVLGIIGLNASAVTVRITGKCNIKENFSVERELKLRIKDRLDRENIERPFPQRTVHIVQENTKE